MKAAEAQDILYRYSDATPEEKRDVGLYSRRMLRGDTTRLFRLVAMNATFERQFPGWNDDEQHQEQLEAICDGIDRRMLPNAEKCRALWPELEPAWTDAIDTLTGVRQALATMRRAEAAA